MDQLVIAAINDDVAQVQTLIANDPTIVRIQDDDGVTALMLLAVHGTCNEQMFRYLIQNGADPNLADYDGRTVLYHAIKNGHRHIVSILLLDPKVELYNIREKYGALYAAIEHDHIHIVSDLLTCPRPYFTKVMTESACLHLTIQLKRFEMTRMFLEHSDRYNLEIPGRPALGEAIDQDAPFDIIHRLLQIGANYRIDAMRRAVLRNKKEVIELLQTQYRVPFDETDLINALKYDDMELFEQIYPEIVPSERIETLLLHEVCSRYSWEKLDFLFKKRYVRDLTRQEDERRRTPLMGAARRGDIDLVNYLCDHGPASQHDMLDIDGNSTLVYALPREHVLDRLLSTKRYANHIDRVHGENTLLISAIYDNHEKSARVLLKHGASRVQPNVFGITPLVQCVWRRRHEIASLLLENPPTPEETPNVHELTDGNRTLLQYSVRYQGVPMVRLLLESGADPQYTTNCEVPPLMYVVRMGETELLEAILDHNPHLVDTTTHEDVDMADEQQVQEYIGRQLLTTAVMREQWDVVNILLDRGADLFGILQLVEEHGTERMRQRFQDPHMAGIIENYVFQFRSWATKSLQFVPEQAPTRVTRSTSQPYVRDFAPGQGMTETQHAVLKRVHFGARAEKPGISPELYHELTDLLPGQPRAFNMKAYTTKYGMTENDLSKQYPNFLRYLAQRRVKEKKRSREAAGGGAAEGYWWFR